MKIVFTTSGSDLDAPLEGRFGRAPKFLVYDLQAGTFEVVDNSRNANTAQGAGTQSAVAVAQLGADCIVTGHCGPRAYRVLAAAGIKILKSSAPTVAEALALYRSGELVTATSADVEGHWA
jgi:predicted Fe-Mo cluster-binding NifX family protein